MATTLSGTQVTYSDATTQTTKFDATNDTGKFIAVNTFTSTGTWTKASGVNKVFVLVQGGGGGASGHSESGGAGGYAEKLIDVSGLAVGATVAVTVGTGGSGITYSSAGGSGTASSFGAYVSASGGGGANTSHAHTGGKPGIGSGGDINLYGGGGQGHCPEGCGKGGSTYFGGSAQAGHHGGTFYPSWTEGLACYGAGGVGTYTTHDRGGYGKGGLVVVYNYS